jgi:hypothetical protein
VEFRALYPFGDSNFTVVPSFFGDIYAPLIYDLFSDAVRNSAKTDIYGSYKRSEFVVENRKVSS